MHYNIQLYRTPQWVTYKWIYIGANGLLNVIHKPLITNRKATNKILIKCIKCKVKVTLK